MGQLIKHWRQSWSQLPQTKQRLISIAGFVVVIGLVGSIIVQSHAATYAVALEAENGTLAGNRTAGPTSGASNNQSVKFGGSGSTPTPTPPTPTPPTPTPPTPTPTPPSPVGTKRMYVNPASGAHAVGSTFSVAIRADSLTEGVSTAQVDMKYSSNLEFQSVDVTGSDYSGLGGCPADLRTISSGVVKLTCFYKVVTGQDAVPLTGDKLIANLSFKVLAAGTGTIDIEDTSSLMSVANSTDVLAVRSDGSYTLQ